MSLKVYSLTCGQRHIFEGWFSSEADYQRQKSEKLLTCPICDQCDIKRLPNVAKIHTKYQPMNDNMANDKSAALTARRDPSISAQDVQALAHLMRELRQQVQKAEDVGERFAEVARQMHYGEIKKKYSIRGQTSVEEARSLREEGIDVMVLNEALLPNLH